MFERTAQYLKKPISPDSVERMSLENRGFLERHEAVLETLLASKTNQFDKYDQRDLLRGHLNKLNFKVNKQLFFSFGDEDNFEVWSLDMKFLGTGNQLIKRLSYTIEDLLTLDWSELFTRDPKGEQEIANALLRLQAGEELVTDVSAHHLVTEKGRANRKAMVQVKAVTLARNRFTNAPAGIVGITNIKDFAN